MMCYLRLFQRFHLVKFIKKFKTGVKSLEIEILITFDKHLPKLFFVFFFHNNQSLPERRKNGSIFAPVWLPSFASLLPPFGCAFFFLFFCCFVSKTNKVCLPSFCSHVYLFASIWLPSIYIRVGTSRCLPSFRSRVCSFAAFLLIFLLLLVALYQKRAKFVCQSPPLKNKDYNNNLPILHLGIV